MNKQTEGDTSRSVPVTKAASTSTRRWYLEEIQALLQTSNTFLYRALIKLYQLQTQDEQRTRTTKHSNGKGFNTVDARPLSLLAQVLLTTNQPLNYKQTALLRRKIMKYSNQITQIANGKLKGVA